MKRLLLLAVGATLLAACSDSPTEPPVPPTSEISPALGGSAQVTTSADDGAGSLRAAIEEANANPSIKIILVRKNLGTVALEDPIHYEGTQKLSILGNGLVLNGAGLAAGESAFLADKGGDLALTHLTIEDAPGYGLQVEVPSTSSGVQSLLLDQVTVRNSGLHGVLMNDQVTPDLDPSLEDDPTTAQAGSNASLVVVISNSTFRNNGFNALDNDGIRINEGGLGSLNFTITGSRTSDNGADGIELDERGAGNVVFNVLFTDILRNGAFDLLTPPASRDLDDGIDVDEWGTGDLIGRFVQVKANDNYEQGVDLNENEAGNLKVTMLGVEGSGNGQEGIEFEEDDDVAGGGNIDADLAGITTNNNGHYEDDEGALGDGGLKSREKGAGDNNTRVIGAVSNGNLGDNGVQVREEGDGGIVARLTGITANNNPVDGVSLREQGLGDILARLTGIVGQTNGEYGIQIREQDDGALDARIVGGTVSGNGDGGVRLRDNGVATIINLTNPNGLTAPAAVTVTVTP